MAFIGAVPGSVEAKDDAFCHCEEMPRYKSGEAQDIHEKRGCEKRNEQGRKEESKKKSGRYRHEEDGVMVQTSSFLSMSLSGRLCITPHHLADMTSENVAYSSSRESRVSALGKWIISS